MLRLTKFRQQFDSSCLADWDQTLRNKLLLVRPLIRPKTHIAIAVGSRGMTHRPQIVKSTVEFVKSQGPCLSSSRPWEATAAGQKQVLHSYGITENVVGAPIRSSMDVAELPQGQSESRLFMDRHAHESDGVIVINRIKPHTDFYGLYESGLLKMCVIGLGKHAAALEIHRFGVHGLKQIMAEEPKLLSLAKANMPSLPVNPMDVLLVDRMGKDISGVGLDTNIIGRMIIAGEAEPAEPNVRSISCVRLDRRHSRRAARTRGQQHRNRRQSG